MVYGLLHAADHSWTSSGVLVPFVGGLALIVLMVVIEARSTDPLIPLSFFRNRTRVVTNIVTLFFSSAFFSYFFLLTLVEQQNMGWGPIKCGLSYLPFGLTIGAGIGIGTGLMPRVGVKRLLAIGFFIDAVGMVLASSIGSGTDYWSDILPGMLLLALGSGLTFPATGNAALHEVTGEDSSLASGIQQAIQQIGGALGLATLASIAVRYAAHHRGDLPGGAQITFWIGAASLAIGGVLVLALMEHVVSVPRSPLEIEPVTLGSVEPEPV